MKLKVITPERMMYEGDISSISMPTYEGEITILEHHIPLITALRAGVIRFTEKSGNERFISVSTGIAKVDASGLMLLADTAEHADELLEEQISRARKEAEESLAHKRTDSHEYAAVAAAIEREAARMKTLKRYRVKKGFGGTPETTQ